MAVEVIKFARPKIWASLQSGGSLTVGQEYFFFCFATKGGAYYGEVTSQASEQISIIPTTGNQTIKMEWWQDGGDVTAYGDAGGGDVTVTTSTAHGRSNGDTAYIRGTTNYDGTYTISNVTSTTFDITVTWVADDGASKWFADIGYHSRANGVFFKWDKYDMIDSGDGKPYQWLNLNDPANSAKSEFDDNEGHRRWSGEKYNKYHTGTSLNFTQEATVTGKVNGYLYDGIGVGSTRVGSATRSLTDIAWREPEYPLDSKFARDKGKLCIYLDGTGNTIRTLITALEDSGYTDMYMINEGDKDWNVGNSITIFGGIFSDGSAETEFNDTSLTLQGGQFCHNSYSGGEVITNRCSIYQLGMSDGQWHNLEATFNDTVVMCSGNAFILDSSDGVGFSPKSYYGAMVYYNKAFSDVNLIGGYAGDYFQWRYQRKDDTSSMTDVYAKDLYVYLVEDGSATNPTGHMTRVEFVNDGLQIYDVRGYWEFQDVNTDKIMECLDVTCDRTDGKIKIYCNNIGIRTWTDTWNMRFGIDLTILDNDGDPIEGAKIDLSWDSGSDTDTTESDGVANVIGLSYQLTHDNTKGIGYYTASDFKELTLKISKVGYREYESKFTISEGLEQKITLKKIYIDDFNVVKK